MTTAPTETIDSGGADIIATNQASAIPVSAGSTIAVTNNGTINMSGIGLNPVGFFLNEGGNAPTPLPAAIMVGYSGVPIFANSPTSRHHICTSCVFGGIPLWLHDADTEPEYQWHR